MTKTISADKLGITASAICLVHCIITPVILSLSSVVANFMPGESSFHRVFAFFVASIGAFAMVVGYRKHRNLKPAITMGIGLTLIFIAALYGESFSKAWQEITVTMLGSFFMIYSHRLNHTFCKGCECSHDH